MPHSIHEQDCRNILLREMLLREMSLPEMPLPVLACAGENVEVHVAAHPGHCTAMVILPVGPVGVGGIVGELADP